MSKGSVTFLGDGAKYEAEVLTSLTEPGSVEFAYSALGNYQESKKWTFSKEEGKYNPVSFKEERERTIFLSLSFKLIAILASDKHGTFDSVQALLDLARDNAEAFNKVYQAAIKANPTLDKEPKEESKPEGESADPN